MSFEGDFYMFLPSNIKSTSGELNTAGKYTTSMPSSIELNDRYECALVDFTYPHTWNNIPDSKLFRLTYSKKPHFKRLEPSFSARHALKFDAFNIHAYTIQLARKSPPNFRSTLEYDGNKLRLIMFPDEYINFTAPIFSILGLEHAVGHDDQHMSHSEIISNRDGFNFDNAEKETLLSTMISFYEYDSKNRAPVTKQMPAGYYANPKDLVGMMNALAPDWFNGQMVYNPLRRGVLVKIQNGESLIISSRLGQILGNDGEMQLHHVSTPGDDNSNFKMNKGYTFPRSIDLEPEFNQLYIYCNILDLTLVGSNMLPILASVPVRGQDGEYVNEQFNTPHYKPVFTNVINSIEMRICDSTGELVKFERGKTNVKLHFRRIRSATNH